MDRQAAAQAAIVHSNFVHVTGAVAGVTWKGFGLRASGFLAFVVFGRHQIRHCACDAVTAHTANPCVWPAVQLALDASGLR